MEDKAQRATELSEIMGFFTCPLGWGRSKQLASSEDYASWLSRIVLGS